MMGVISEYDDNGVQVKNGTFAAIRMSKMATNMVINATISPLKLVLG